jgi:nuclear-control-of-ATPase protein 2
LLSKATTQAYGQVLETILQQTIPLEDDIWYWDDVLSTYRYAGLYSIQTSPLRLWSWSKDIYHDVRSRGGELANGWRQFYGLVKDAVQERSIADIQRRVVSPLALVRNEGRRKQAALKRIRLVNANALGILLGEGLSNERYGPFSLPILGSYSLPESSRVKEAPGRYSSTLQRPIERFGAEPEFRTRGSLLGFTDIL